MPKLIFGVLDIPYSNAPEPAPARKGKSKKAPRTKKTAATVTTGDVAEFIENKYHPMEVYWEIHGQEVADKMTEGMVGAMENLLAGAPLSVDPFAEAESFIDSGFKNFINHQEMDSLGYPGVPTKASLEGISHRFKKKRGGPRPSFVDTGLYISSFKPEIEE